MGEIVRSDTGGELSRTYWHKDLLGSPEVLTNAAGSVIHRQHFSAFGISDNPTWQSSNPTVRRVRRGYTGHEHDPETGLVNMGARLYDGVTARFMTPDPGVQMPGWTQSWNRFSYVWNNPMSFVDPTGLEGEATGGDEQVVPDGFGLVVTGTPPETPSSETASDIPVAEIPQPTTSDTSPVESPAPLTLPAGAGASDVGTPSAAPGAGTGDETAPPSRERNWENAQKGFRDGALDEIEFFIDVASLNPLNFFRRNSVINALKAGVPSDPQGRSQYDNARIAVSVIVAGATLGVGALGEGAAAEGAELAEGASSKIAQVTEGQLNKFLVKPFHGSSFGLTGNWNPGRVGEISRVINQHINAEGTLAIQGTYRGASVTHFLNPSTGLNVMVDSNGAFVSGWALSAEQQASVLFTGRLF